VKPKNLFNPSMPSNDALRVKWSNSLMHAGPYPATCKRFFKLETLLNAVEKCLNEKDRFIHAGLTSIAGDVPIVALQGDLTYEDENRLVFSLVLTTRARKRVCAQLTVAKNHEECSATLEKECMALGYFSGLCPERIISPTRYGFIYLPDRHKRKDVKREVFAYFCAGPPTLAPLYVASPTQLAPHGPKPKRYTLKETEFLKQSIIGIVARCYTETTFLGIDPDDLYPECFAIKEQQKSGTSVHLVQCPRVRKKLRTGHLIQKLLFGTIKTQKQVLPLAPARPEMFFTALAEAITPEKAREWCNAFFSHRKALIETSHMEKDISLPGRDYLEILGGAVNG
jgi:hypothetical protein